MPCATRPAARQRPLPDPEIVGEVSFMDGPFRDAGDTPPSTGEESGRILSNCLCVPAGGTSAANYSEQEMRHILVL
jgi:hypothetical protein